MIALLDECSHLEQLSSTFLQHFGLFEFLHVVHRPTFLGLKYTATIVEQKQRSVDPIDTYLFEVHQGHFIVDWSVRWNVELLDASGGLRFQFQLRNFAFRHLGDGVFNTEIRDKQRFVETKAADGIWSLRTLRECFVGSLRRG